MAVFCRRRTGNDAGGKWPSDYERLSYIESTGTQYINSDVYVNGNTQIVCDFQIKPSSGTWKGVFGGDEDPAVNKNCICFWLDGNGKFRYYFGTNTYVFCDVQNGAYDRYTLDCNRNTVTIGGSTYSTPSAVFSCKSPLYVFAVSGEAVVSSCIAMRLYSFLVYDAGRIIRSMVPCKNSAGEVGLYDTLGRKFYGNVGTGSFIAGPTA